MEASLEQIAQSLRLADRIAILSHSSPDGDTLGCASALAMTLQGMGKQAKVVCSDPIPRRLSYLFDGVEQQEFEPAYVISVDVAEPKLLGPATEPYLHRLDACIDHHRSNSMAQYASLSYVDTGAGAACEIMYELVRLLAPITQPVADSLYTGLCTDTGCFRFSNTTSRTHRIAADLQELGCRAAQISRELFDTKSKGRLMAEQQVLQGMEFYFEDQVALIVIPQSLLRETGIDPSELDGLAALPRQIQGVEVGITLKERPDGGYKASLRSTEYVDVSEICQGLGGGGHVRAAGCSFDGGLEEFKRLLLDAVGPALKK